MFPRMLPNGFLTLALLLSIAVGAGCGGKKADEKLAEGMMERTLQHATGGKADVDLQGGDVKIKTADGQVEIAKTNDWPSDMFADVPRFTHGTVERVSKGQADGTQTFNVYLRDVEEGAFEKYQAEIQAAGWESQAMMQGGSGGMISAQKGKLALQFVYNKSDGTGVVMAHLQPE